MICKEEVLELSKIEYKLLLYFLENQGQILSKEQILERALEMGVDDYMSKPFSIAVLKARIKKLLSRKSEIQWISSNGIRLDKSSCQEICKEEVLEMSKIEYKLLLYFIENQVQIF